MAALNNRGNVLEKLGRLDDALESYDLALKISPTNADILVNKGNVLKI
jgi:tetratricopeptide (TPR) repeat protein